MEREKSFLSPPFFRIKCEGAGICYAMGLLFLIVCLLWLPAPASSTGGVYESTRHGDATTGVERISGEPKGDCTQCHDEHASRNGVPTSGGPYDYLLFKANDNNLCYTNNGVGPCHTSAGANKIYQGSTIYDNSSHATSANMYWPGPTPPARPSSDYGKCLNCHTPHGYKDASGLIPSQTFSREENLCQACHDGSLASDIQSEMTKTYRHPAGDYTSRHSQSEDGVASNFGSSNRHAECVDCHNAHYAKSDAIIPSAPYASNRNKGVSGVSVINGGAGSQPSYTYISPDVGVDYEYQLCFKCHSSWTTQPGGQPDMAVLFNPNNPSYHPVEAQGNNTNILSGAFVNGWAPTDMMYCTDCHTSDNSLVRGPHGSQYNYILKRYYVKSSAERTISSAELCFDCHNYDTYANRNASQTVKEYSRWAIGMGMGGSSIKGESIKGESIEGGGMQKKSGHTYHVGEEGYPCYACHDSHSSTAKPHLIATGRNPGLNNYEEYTDGGKCWPTCHMSVTYSLYYPR